MKNTLKNNRNHTSKYNFFNFIFKKIKFFSVFLSIKYMKIGIYIKWVLFSGIENPRDLFNE